MSDTGQARLPMVVLGGYLGAGKTTLIHRLLTGDGDLRCGVLVNDFGEVNIDEQLIANQSGETMALTNGCACCSIQNDLVTAVGRLLAIANDLDLILVEASGVAHPDKIAAIGDSWPGLSRGLIVVAVDATDLERLESDKFVGPLVRRQIEVADQVVLTKTDIAEPSQIERASSSIAALRPDRDSALLQGLEDRQLRVWMTVLPGEHGDGAPAVATEEGFWNRTLRGGDAVARASVGVLLSQIPQRIERIKGFFNANDGHRYLVQGTGSSATVTGCEGEGPTELLVIGSGPEPVAGDPSHDWLERLEAALLAEDSREP